MNLKKYGSFSIPLGFRILLFHKFSVFSNNRRKEVNLSSPCELSAAIINAVMFKNFKKLLVDLVLPTHLCMQLSWVIPISLENNTWAFHKSVISILFLLYKGKMRVNSMWQRT